MKKYFVVILFSSFIFACGKKDLGTALPVDQGKLDAASASLCPANLSFQMNRQEFLLGKDTLPSPIIYAIQKGGASCASLNNIDHGGISSWLQVNYSSDCIRNGTLWLADSLRVEDGRNVYFNLKSAEANSDNWIHVYTSVGYSVQSLKSEMGLVVYSCMP